MIDLTDIRFECGNTWTIRLDDGSVREYTLHSTIGLVKAFAKTIIERGYPLARADQARAAETVKDLFGQLDRLNEGEVSGPGFLLGVYPNRVITNLERVTNALLPDRNPRG